MYVRAKFHQAECSGSRVILHFTTMPKTTLLSLPRAVIMLLLNLTRARNS